MRGEERHALQIQEKEDLVNFENTAAFVQVDEVNVLSISGCSPRR